ATLEGMEAALGGLATYAANLSSECRRLADAEADPKRKHELGRMARALARVPRLPARNLYEALAAVWLAWIALHNENTNTGFSLGRLDQVLQPYFLKDMEGKKTPAAREKYIREALELLGDFFLRTTDHVPLVPDIGNHLFGGSSSDQAITLGGVTPDGGDAVCDMTYLLLKVTEMLGLRDPNVNARFCPGVNSDAYLLRLCEVNHVTGATPSLHNDLAVFEAWKRRGVPMEHLRDWSATGCVEPTISGRHMGHTGSILFNLVAPLEMALGNGVHPLLGPETGPETGDPATDFPDFESFFAAYETQLFFLQDRAAEYNRHLAAAHAEVRPTPLLSALISGCVEKAADVTVGGAQYNTSGTSNIGLADVADSLAAVKKLVYEDQALSFAELLAAVREGLDAHPRAAALLRTRAPRFGSGDPDAMAMANRVAGLVRRGWDRHVNFRGGPYTTGFWSMSQHVAYGLLSGALPSGHPARTPFTPGLTPAPAASRSLLDNLRDVARLDPENLDNNVAFNVKIPPGGPGESESTIRAMAAYARAYFDMGGMQMQMNVVDSKTLKDAMARPEAYKSLLVRISGYNAYFTTLNRDMQMELVHRAEYGV
ncbi:MAG: formate acetyltransferase, partial [Proteobacteria bacterium]|nr:formate acetyltransferase [Pseudomonadota bacterium]